MVVWVGRRMGARWRWRRGGRARGRVPGGKGKSRGLAREAGFGAFGRGGDARDGVMGGGAEGRVRGDKFSSQWGRRRGEGGGMVDGHNDSDEPC